MKKTLCLLIMASLLWLPAAQAEQSGKRVVVDKSLHVLVLYDKDNNPIQYYPISCGTFEKPTREGDLYIVYKTRDPHWLPSNWEFYSDYFKDPTPIEPYKDNKGNPLGTTFTSLNWEDFGIHGTNAPLCIGRHVSSGCVRMHIPDNEKIYPEFEQGMPVKIRTDETVPWKVSESYSTWWGLYDIVSLARRIESQKGDK